MYLAVHSAVDCIFVPPGVKGKDYDNQKELTELAEATSDFIKSNSVLVSEEQVQAMNDWNTAAVNSCDCPESEVPNLEDCPCGTRKKPGLLLEMKTFACTVKDLGEASGGGDDWAMLKGAKYAYTPELPPSWKGFQGGTSKAEEVIGCDNNCFGFQVTLVYARSCLTHIHSHRKHFYYTMQRSTWLASNTCTISHSMSRK